MFEIWVPRGYDHYGPRVKDYSKIREHQELKINNEGELIKKAFYWKIEGLNDKEIRLRLSNHGLELSKQFISAMWRKPFYCGIIIHKMLDAPVKGNWEPLISNEIFRQIQNIISKNNVGYSQNKLNEEAPLSKFIHCNTCKSKMSFYKNKKKDKSYYKCNNCKGMNINANATSNNKMGAHELFESTLKKFKLDDELIPLFKKQLELTFKYHNQNYYENKKILERNLEFLRKFSHFCNLSCK